jgi:hypothetical protein
VKTNSVQPQLFFWFAKGVVSEQQLLNRRVLKERQRREEFFRE